MSSCGKTECGGTEYGTPSGCQAARLLTGAPTIHQSGTPTAIFKFEQHLGSEWLDLGRNTAGVGQQ